MDTEQTYQLEKNFNPNTNVIRIETKNLSKLGAIINLEKFPNLYYLHIDGNIETMNQQQKFKLVNFCDSVKKIYFSDILVQINNLPERLEDLTLWYCNLCDDDMINLPEGLKNLNCPHNNITKLSNLSFGLKKLDCSNNKILYLDDLPESLEYLNCSNNKIINLNNLPNGLIYLDCSQCSIKYLDTLPDTLEQVFAKFNNIESIKRLPSNLTRANFTNNPLVSAPKCNNSLILLNYSLDAEKASTSDKILQYGYKFAYGSYHTAKYTTYGIGIGLFGVIGLLAYPLSKAYL